MFDGHAHQPGHIVDIQLCHQAAPMLFDRFHTQVQQMGNSSIGMALGDQLQHLALAPGESVEGGLFLTVGCSSALRGAAVLAAVLMIAMPPSAEESVWPRPSEPSMTSLASSGPGSRSGMISGSRE